MKVFGIVYVIINMLNGKCYVGQTKKSLKERFRQHITRKRFLIGQVIKDCVEKNHFFGKHHTLTTHMGISLKNLSPNPYQSLIAEMNAHQITYTVLAKVLELGVVGKFRKCSLLMSNSS